MNYTITSTSGSENVVHRINTFIAPSLAFGCHVGCHRRIFVVGLLILSTAVILVLQVLGWFSFSDGCASQKLMHFCPPGVLLPNTHFHFGMEGEQSFVCGNGMGPAQPNRALTFLEMRNHPVSNISLSSSLGLSCNGINPLPPDHHYAWAKKKTKWKMQSTPPTSTPYS